MAKPNISAVLSPTDVTSIKTSFNDAKAKMPFLIGLSPVERKKLFKMGIQGVGFMKDGQDAVNNNPSWFPANFDIPEYNKDANLISAISDILGVLDPIYEAIIDTFMALGAEGMKQANIIYAQLKVVAKNDAAADILREKMAQRYKNLGPKEKTPPQQ